MMKAQLPGEQMYMEMIAKLPQGYISVKTINGKDYPYYQWKEDGKVKSRYVKKEEYAKLSEDIKKRQEYQKILQSMRQQKRLAEYAKTNERYLDKRPHVGMEFFSDLIEMGAFYVDKTAFIKEWWEDPAKITLITRPRRFGKTMNLSMLECFFSNAFEGRSDLFEGLQIWEYPYYRRLQGTCILISVSFSGIKDSDPDAIFKAICTSIAVIYAQHAYLCNSEQLSDKDKELFSLTLKSLSEKIYGEEVYRSLKTLTYLLCKHYKRKVLLLIDEYDTPMIESFTRQCFDEVARMMKKIFHYSFKDNPYLEKGLITGITRIAKESLFSDLNNLVANTTTTKQYETCFGFTEKEVFDALEAQNLGSDDNKRLIKEWYDGYRFGDTPDIYNPWSVSNYLYHHDLQPYWANTSDNALLGQLLAKSDGIVMGWLEDLICGKSVEATINEAVAFEDIDIDKNALFSLMVASGYLRVDQVKMSIDFETYGERTYTLSLVNHEVRMILRNLIKRWFIGSNGCYNAFINSLLRCDIKAMIRYMNQTALGIFSVFDVGGKPSVYTEPERFYHGFVLGLLVELRGRYEIKSNRESGFGRYDVVMIPFKSNDPAFILEFKIQEDDEKDLSDTVKKAKKQIEEKEYETELLERGIEESRIHSYGFAFCGKQCLIG